MKVIGIDSIVIKFNSRYLSLEDFLHWLQFKNTVKLTYISEGYSEAYKEYLMRFDGTDTKINIQYHKPTKTITLEIYGIFQYEEQELVNAINIVLEFIESFYYSFGNRIKPTIARVDIDYDIQEPLSKLSRKITRRTSKKGFKKPERYFEGHKLKGFSYNKKTARFRLVVYDKQLKNNLPMPITRVELCMKEKYKKPVKIDSFFCFCSYLKLLLNEFEEFVKDI